jgi:hypothetical protein
MQLIGRRSVASVIRWVLGFLNVFVAIGVVLTAIGVTATFVSSDFASGFMDGFNNVDDPNRALGVSERVTFIAGFVASISTWWVINRLRRIFKAVNLGDAFEPANVHRLRGVGVGLIGVQVSAAILSFSVPLGQGMTERDFDPNLGSWLGILVVFMLAEVFRQGSAMRDDQQMTV